MKPAVDAPPQENYEKVQVTFSGPEPRVKTALKSPGSTKPKKQLRWKPDHQIKQVFFFELDETERGEYYIFF